MTEYKPKPNPTIIAALDMIDHLKQLKVPDKTIRYMAIIAMEDSEDAENLYGSEVWRKVLRYIADPERRAKVRARQDKLIEEVSA